jgi:BirA family biotin operon repressor/biotin-[acetyl-CoA-carboxylase] ligase
MHLPRSREIVPELELMPQIGSTNAELVARASGGLVSDFTVIATTNQTAGRGRLDRVWVAPPGRTIAVSVLLAPGAVALERLGWLPLLAGLAMTRAVLSLVVNHEVTLKWPNDVQVDGLKVSGLLAELVRGSAGVVVGAGLNLTIPADDLPTPTATSLGLVGVAEDEIVDRALAAYLGELHRAYTEFSAETFDAQRGLRAAVSARCSTLGREVRVELPGADDLYGLAESLDELGRLQVRTKDARLHSIAAGDVTHLRYQ